MASPGKPILVGYDGSAASRLALDHAAALAKRSAQVVVVVNVVPATLKHLSLSEMLLPGIDLNKLVKPESFREAARKRMEEVAAEVRKRGVEVQLEVRAGDGADELIQAAKDHDAEQVVLGYMSYEHKVPYGVGTVAEKVMRYCDRTVTLVRPPGASARGPKGA
jgi:nucleotide-binding universal stress UspA family protein